MRIPSDVNDCGGLPGPPGPVGPPGPPGPPGPAGDNTIDVEDEGVDLGAFSKVNFVGAGVTAVDAGGGVAQVTVPGGITGIEVFDEAVDLGSFQAFAFVGGGVTATDAGGGVAQISIPAAPIPTNNAILFWGCDDVGAATTTRFAAPGYEAGIAPTTDRMQLPMPRAGTLKNLYVRHNTAAGIGVAVTYTVMVNGVATAITVNLATGAVGQTSDNVNTIAVAAGDRVSIRMSKGAVVGDGRVDANISLEVA